jgi:hypothetical protein
LLHRSVYLPLLHAALLIPIGRVFESKRRNQPVR